MTRELTVTDLLDVAQRLLDEPTPSTVSAWSRASALLARQALEQTLVIFWRARAPGVEHVNMRAQLNCLQSYFGPPALAKRTSFAWTRLSHATHHQPYELDLTREELNSLLADVRRLVVAVAKVIQK